MGKHFSKQIMEFSTLIEILRWRALQQPEQKAYTFLQDGEVEESHLTYGNLDCQARAIAALLQSQGLSGERALLLYPPGLEYITAFFGCLYAQVVAVPAYPPRLNRSIARLQAIVADAQATVILTTTTLLTQIERQWPLAPNLKTIKWLTTDSPPSGLEDSWQEIAVNSNTLAFLQYTSGSTSVPKGVMVSHGNIIHNETIIQKAMAHTEKTIFVGWLPLFHDMGLIGNLLQPLYLGIPCILMSPVAFLQRPLRWLQAISRYQATTSGGPNFAYDLCVSKITEQQKAELDLRSWQVAFNGSEPIRAQTIERFTRTFADCGFRREAFYPCYGMAETTLIVSGGFKAAPPVFLSVEQAALAQNRVVASSEQVGVQTLVGCGQPLQDLQIVITHPETATRCAPDEVGEIWVTGPSVSIGYWNKIEQTKQTFQAYLTDSGEGPFLRTGDLGFLWKGELFITGRLKDLIVIRGRNHYPQDIEKTVEQSHSALQLGGVAAFSIESDLEERLVVAVEVKRNYLRNLNVDEVISSIRHAVLEEHELQVYGVLLLKTGSIPKTSSGKIQRYACRNGFLSESLEIVGSSILEDSYTPEGEVILSTEALRALTPCEGRLKLASYLQKQVAQVLKVAPSQIDSQQPLSGLGLDSLIAIELQNQIETNLGVVLPMVRFLQSSSIDQLAGELLDKLLTSAFAQETTLAPALTAKTETALSYGQQALYFLHQLAPESPAYNIVGVARLQGELDIPALARAFQSLVERHPMLRTTFTNLSGQPIQRIHEHREVCFQHEDVSTWSEASLNDRLVAEAHRPFNLEQGSLLRVNLFTRYAQRQVSGLSPQEHTLLLVMHHLIADFWSGAVLMHELGILYQTHKAGTKATLSPLAVRYTDYVRTSVAMLASPTGKKLSAYWQKQLAGELPVLNLPTDRPRPPIQTYRGASQSLKLSADLTQRLKTLSLANRATLYMTLLAAFQVLLYRYTGQEDLLVGSPTIGRNQADLAWLVGYFVNPVVLRANLAGNPTFKAFLDQVRACVLDALAHQDYPFALLVEQLQPIRDPSRSPLFQVMFVLQKAHLLEEGVTAFALGEPGVKIKLGELELESLSLSKGIAQFDLTLMIAEVDGALCASWQYNTDLFDPTTIARMANHFQTLLEGIVADPETLISDLPLLTHFEQQQLQQWSATAVNYYSDTCLHQLFETQVEQTPDAVAVVFVDEQITYQELNQRANQLAHHLQSLGVKPEALVGIYLERSLCTVVSLLAVLKAGGAYVPLDPTYPDERLAFMLEDAQVSVLLTQQELVGRLPKHKAHIVCWKNDSELHHQSVDNPVSKVTADNLAYVIYTSGSTGKPKGVMNTHRGICNRLFWMQDTYQLTLRDRVLQKTPFSFDVSIWEFFWPLMTGATLVVARPRGHQDSAYLVRLIQQQQITTLHFVPSMLQVFLEEPGVETCHSLRQVMCSGEALSFQLQERFFARLNADLHNLYGPTEAAIDVTFWACKRHSHKHIVPIGSPIANTQIYLLDTHQNLVPIGVPGELHIGGVGLARGYLNQAELTSLKFIPNPFQRSRGAEEHGSIGEAENQFSSSERLYKTGDLARYLPDGNIEFLGRIDHQVKLRGFRIELAEIEVVLSQHPAVQEVVVLVRDSNKSQKFQDFTPIADVENPSNITGLRRLLKGEIAAESGKEQLVAYCVTRGQPAPTVTELRRFLVNKLPDYMIPAAFVMLDALPLTPNGKIDRRSLPNPGQTRPDLEKAFVAPRTQVEEILAQVWAEVLNIQQVGIHDNFFELGGDSIRSIQVLAKAQARNLSFSLEQLFQHQTIDTLAQAVTLTESSFSNVKTEAFSLLSDQDRQKLPQGVEDAYPLARVQAGVIFHTQSMPDSPMYHDIFLYNLQVHLDTEIFQACVQQVVDRHPILRTSFDLTHFSEPLQLVHQTVVAPFQVEDLRGLSPDAQQKALATWIEAEKRRNFDWSCPPFIRFFIHRLTEQSFYLTFSCHTSILDGWSKACLLTELLHRYHTLLNGEVIAIEPTPTIAYRDFIALERLTLKSKECRDYWTQKLAGCVTTKLSHYQTHLTTDTPQIGFLDVQISREISDGLKKLARRAEVPLKSVLLTAHLKVMSLLSGEIDVLTGLESNGRLEEADGEKTLGIHLNTVPFRLKLKVGTWIELVQQVFEAERELLPFRRYPYADLHQLVGRQALQPLVDTVFNYTHFHVYQHLQALKDVEVLGARGFGETHFTLRSEFNLNHASDCLQLDLECNLTQIGNAQLETIGSYFTETLTAMSTQPLKHHESQCLLPERERLTLLEEWNNTAAKYPQNCCVHQQIEAIAAQTPDAIAVVFDQHRLTYQELNTRANALAHYLQRLGVRPNVRVALCVERSLEMIVGILGILKSGGAYVPLDPTYPQERLTFLLKDAHVPVLLTQARLIEKLPQHQTAILCLDSDWDIVVTESTENPIITSTLENLAYLIYTSGSTGQPKGVLITHQNLAHSTNARIAYYPEPFTSFLLVSSFAFDSSIGCIFWTLCQGKTLVLPREGLQKDIWQLTHLINHHQVSHWLSIPSLYSALLTHIESTQLLSLRTVIVAGESCTTELVERHYQQLPHTSLFNEYGPTEGTVWCSVYNCQNHDLKNPVPIGRPIANTQIYLLDSYLQPVPVGVPGEIHIGGKGLAIGYHNRSELTAEKFIPNPFHVGRGAGEQERLYKTGDLGRYRPDGNIEFLGRIDYQVKLRGYRIELTAIEAVLLQHSEVLQAVVSVWEELLNKRLVGYVVLEPESATTTNELQRFLRQNLPEYMIPTVWVKLDALPLNANGKVDRQNLPAPQQVLNSTQPELEADPRTPVEKTLATLWTQALRLERVGIYDNFFELGGDSIQSIQIIAKANQAGLSLSTNQLFEHPTIAELATVVGQIQPRQLQQEPVEGPVALTPIQHWFFEQNFPEPHYWNQAVLLEVQPDCDPWLLEAAFQQLLIHHDALRLRFAQTQGHWQQTNHGPEEKVCFAQFDLSDIPILEQEPVMERIATELQSSLNLTVGPLLKVAYFCCGFDKPSRMLLVLHHLVVDGVSFRILLEDLQTAYQQLSNEETISLPPKTTSFQQWSKLLQEYAQSPQLQQELAYWVVESQLIEAEEKGDTSYTLPVDYPEGSNIEGSNRTVSVSLTPEETRALLQEVPATYHTEINEVLLTALVQTTSQWTGTPHLLIDLEGHGREDIFAGVDLSRTVGWFTSVFPVQLNIDKAQTPVEALISVKEQLRRIPKRGIGYGLLRYCSEDQEILERLRTQPQAELIFNYLGQFDQVLHQSSLLRLTNESHGQIKSSDGTRSYLLRVSGKVLAGQFQMIWAYSENLHRQATVEMLAQRFLTELRLLIAHSQSTDSITFTPSDFPEAELSQEDLSNILGNYT